MYAVVGNDERGRLLPFLMSGLEVSNAVVFAAPYRAFLCILTSPIVGYPEITIYFVNYTGQSM